MFSPAPSRLLLRIECWCTRGERSPSHMLQTAAHGASCLNLIFELDNNHSWARLIHLNPWTYSPAGMGSKTVICPGVRSHVRVVSMLCFRLRGISRKSEQPVPVGERASCYLSSRLV